MTAWLHIVGVGPAMDASLSPPARRCLEAATTIICPHRYRDLAAHYPATVIEWCEEYRAIQTNLAPYSTPDHAPVVLLVTGDPLWFSAGSALADAFPCDALKYYPQVSAFQLAASRLHWPLDQTTCISVLGRRRPVRGLLPALAPHARILALSPGHETTGRVIRLLIESGYGESSLTLLGEMDSSDEVIETRMASGWQEHLALRAIPAFHVIAIVCRSTAPTLPATRAPGLPDTFYDSTRKFTRSEVRAVTVAALRPAPRKVLWDLGTGTGSVAIEWLRLATLGTVHAVDRDPDRIAGARANAQRLGVPSIAFLHDDVESAAAVLVPAPDAVFIGGGLSPKLVDIVLQRLVTHGRLVVNAVTLESESLLADLHRSHGGELVRIAVARSIPVGTYRGWKQFMPVTQWRFDT